MRFLTKHFAFVLERQWGGHPRCWHMLSLHIALIHRPDRYCINTIPYRYWLCCDFQLLPNLIWYQTFLGDERGRPVLQARIIGIQSWPFYFNIKRLPDAVDPE